MTVKAQPIREKIEPIMDIVLRTAFAAGGNFPSSDLSLMSCIGGKTAVGNHKDLVKHLK